MTVPLSDAQLAATAAGREAVRAMFSGGAFPAALGQAIADEVADAAMAPLLAEVERLRAELAQARTEPIVARWSRGVTHHDAGTTVECVDVDDPLRGIALELTLDDREALGLMLVDPEGEMDQADDDEHLRADHFNEAADLIVGSCFTHTPGIQEGWMSCHCDAAAALRAVARHAVARQADDTTSKEA